MTNIERCSAESLAARLPEFIELLRDSVDTGASIGFIPPLTDETANAYWLGIVDDLSTGSRILLNAYEDDQLAGNVQLGLAEKENARHRAEVQKLLVHTRWRNRGIAKKLLNAVDTAAREADRTLLVLDTIRGDVAEGLYERFGYVKAGIIPQYARNEKGLLEDTVVFYRILT